METKQEEKLLNKAELRKKLREESKTAKAARQLAVKQQKEEAVKRVKEAKKRKEETKAEQKAAVKRSENAIKQAKQRVKEDTIKYREKAEANRLGDKILLQFKSGYFSDLTLSLKWFYKYMTKEQKIANKINQNGGHFFADDFIYSPVWKRVQQKIMKQGVDAMFVFSGIVQSTKKPYFDVDVDDFYDEIAKQDSEKAALYRETFGTHMSTVAPSKEV